MVSGKASWDSDGEDKDQSPAEKAYVSIADSAVGNAIVQDFSEAFTTPTIFSSWETLIHWVQEIGRQNGLVVVIQHSEAAGPGRRARLTFACERSGEYRSSAKYREKQGKKPRKLTTKGAERKTVETSTKKCGCPFKLKAVKLPSDDDWMVRVVCGVHNHPHARHLEGHSYAGRLSSSEEVMMVAMSERLIKPRDILHTIQAHNISNVSTMKNIYNARAKHRVVERAGRSEMQSLLHHLHESGYVEWHTTDEATPCVQSIFWAHPTSVELLRAFPEVLVMDCTYKSNKYRLPLLEIVGATSTNLTYAAAFAYLQSETEGTYSWALDKLNDLMNGCVKPRVIVTDRDLALMNAVERVFPKMNHMLCKWHIYTNILANCRKTFETPEKWNSFLCTWNLVVSSPTVDAYAVNLQHFERTFMGYPKAIEYIKDSWLNKYNEKFVAAWTDCYMHFGNLSDLFGFIKIGYELI